MTTKIVLWEATGYTGTRVAQGALRAAEHGVDGVGALDPVQAFGLDPLTDGASAAGVVAAAG